MYATSWSGIYEPLNWLDVAICPACTPHFCWDVPFKLAPVVSATDCLRTKSWDISLDCHIPIYRKIIRSNIFFRVSNISVPCPHAQLRGRTVIKKLWTFFGPWSRVRSQSPPCWIFRIKQIHQSTASERKTRLPFKYARHTRHSEC